MNRQVVTVDRRILTVHHRPRTGQASLLGVSNDIASVVNTFQPHIIVGDFNTQLDVSNWLTTNFTAQSYQLALNDATTNDNTQIDGVYVHSNAISGTSVNVLEETFSFHHPILCHRAKT